MTLRKDARWARQQLDCDVPALWQRLDRLLTKRAVRDWLSWCRRRKLRDRRAGDNARERGFELAQYLGERCESLNLKYAGIEARYRLFLEQMQTLDDPASIRTAVLTAIADLGASPRLLRGDAKAFARWMGPDALGERIDRMRADIERELIFVLDRLGRLSERLAVDSGGSGREDIRERFDLKKILIPMLAFPGHARVREAALRCARRIHCAAPVEAATERAILQFAYRTALDAQQPVWMQCEALRLIAHRDPAQVVPILTRRIDANAHPDDLFLRRRAVDYCLAAGGDALATLLPRLASDPSDFVRQGIAEALPRLPAADVLNWMSTLLRDRAAPVVAQALCALPLLCARNDAPELRESAQACLEDMLMRADADTFAMRTALRVAGDWPLPHAKTARIRRQEVLARLLARLGDLHRSHPTIAIRRAAAQARERLRMRASEDTLPEIVQSLRLGQRTTLPAGDADPIAIARQLSVAANEDFGFDLEVRPRGGLRVTRDYRWGMRLWRFMHELRHPSTDKRQNHSHVRGRIYRGLIHVPAGKIAEVSRTKVPGEPLHVADEGGWRPWLPLLDQVLSALDQGWPAKPLRIVTSEGVTSVVVPDGFAARLRAKWAISRHFARIAALRNWQDDSPFGPNAYVEELARYGIGLRFEPHASDDGRRDPADPTVLRFFERDLRPAAAALFGVPTLGQPLRDYAQSLHQNDIPQLVAFVLALSAWFYGEHLLLNRLFRRARNAIPLVMGGWGTRGKSGTERIKAGVLAGLGLTVVSKTTGCEAMFLYGRANRPLSEMFLFRPYDKATIWEQARLTRMAAALGADAYLWECMALNPRYVRILQHRWMRDDVSTITNCFPDHEDIQGPAGVDLPVVISEFVPTRGRLVTSEENMRPYLESAARARKTEISHVDWLDAGLLTQDILDRFPYQEHPYNIALVARMYADLGLPRDVSLKEMADHVVPDLGVLKIYPEATIDGRSLEFINGMSANERHGTISNWLRTGMDRHALDRDPEVWTCTVVNNRADRVARSQVFAALLVNDIGADRHVLIGGNLDGLHQFIRSSFDEFMARFDWNDAARDRRSILDGLLRRWRVPRDRGEADARLRAACIGLGMPAHTAGTADDWLKTLSTAGASEAHVSALRAQHDADLREAEVVRGLQDRLQRGDRAQQDIVSALWTLFSARLITVRDYYTKGNTLIRDIAMAAPPGLRIRCMGLQNIKGTGLDFVYRWQAWDRHARLCERMLARQPDVALDAVRTLSASPELGILEYERIAQTIARARGSHVSQSDEYQACLRTLEQQRQESYARIFASAEKKAESRWRRWIVPKAEQLIDGFDAIRRRRTSNRIYRDLIAGRIGSQKAVLLLQGLTQRQKGGWL